MASEVRVAEAWLTFRRPSALFQAPLYWLHGQPVATLAGGCCSGSIAHWRARAAFAATLSDRPWQYGTFVFCALRSLTTIDIKSRSNAFRSRRFLEVLARPDRPSFGGFFSPRHSAGDQRVSRGLRLCGARRDAKN
jgi:hypothetical protein